MTALARESWPSVLIVAENASEAFGGEAAIPLQYFMRLRNRGVNAFLVVHERNRDALARLLPTETDRISFVPDTLLHKIIWHGSTWLPAVVRRVSTEPALILLTEWFIRRNAKHVIRKHGIMVVHQPTPVSPKAVSVMYGLGVPVVFGPLNGGMTYPKGFHHIEGRTGRGLVHAVRWLSGFLHRLLPGKQQAHTILVANERTRAALPMGLNGRVIELVENGVDPKIWKAADSCLRRYEATGVRIVFVGRLVGWKGIDYLLKAFVLVLNQVGGSLEIIGDGVERTRLTSLAEELGISSRVTFSGWLSQEQIAKKLHLADIFVLPSVWECGGSVVLEAMASGVPVVATRWGGPADYLDDQTGVLVTPVSPTQFPIDLADAILKLAKDPDLRRGLAARAAKVASERFDWDRKVDRILQIYCEASLCR